MVDMRQFTCHNCGNLFRRSSQWEFFCSSRCRGENATKLGLSLEDTIQYEMDDLAIIMYEEYLDEVNEKKDA